jgi:hypothetical protein
MELTIHPFLGLPDGDLLEELLDLHTRILAISLKSRPGLLVLMLLTNSRTMQSRELPRNILYTSLN